MDAPFLDFSFYVGAGGVRPAIEALVPGLPLGALPEQIHRPGLIGLMEGAEVLQICDEHVVLRTEGDVFCNHLPDNRSRRKRLGRRVYERFVEVADTIRCFYGAILVEYPLETPEQIRRDPRSLAFRDFFVSEESLDAAMVRDVVALAGEEAFVEMRRRGVHVWMIDELNPIHRHLDELDWHQRSSRIAQVLGNALP
ncbi:hypothetical protein [Chondromyces crocatus]|uniref:Uncharacterized protein n=1 Tax=Chondromyces crocatus TaxID=52 RepID=A0A0K1EAB0_CHOCO|nr:hypothetical protein [Chondromyces crocatus]AKT37789.1 uncharacterized protein CMC5_019310 [Chondromyces crocatus]